MEYLDFIEEYAPTIVEEYHLLYSCCHDLDSLEILQDNLYERYENEYHDILAQRMTSLWRHHKARQMTRVMWAINFDYTELS